MTEETGAVDTVEVFDKATRLGTAEVDTNGNWHFEASTLAGGEHIFRAQAKDLASASWRLTVASAELTLTLPHIRHADSVGDNREQINYYAHQGRAFVEVPDYGMQPGDTVRVQWVGRRYTETPLIQTVATPPRPLVFEISKYEVIDCIGTNAAISYTVIRPPNDKVHRSPTLILTVNGHIGDIQAPSINPADHNKVTVRFEKDYYTAILSSIGKTTVQSPLTLFNGKDIVFNLDTKWVADNRGSRVIFNYSLKRFGNESIYYSQILRVPNL